MILPQQQYGFEYRENAKAADLSRKAVMDFPDFKLSIAKSLRLDNQEEEDMECEAKDDEQSESKRRSLKPIPNKRCRRPGDTHLVEFMKNKQKSRSSAVYRTAINLLLLNVKLAASESFHVVFKESFVFNLYGHRPKYQI